MPAFSDHLALSSLRAQGYKSRYVRTSVGRIHVLDARGRGELPPLVLLHGFSSASVHYFPLVLHLRSRVKRLILPDLPAHGFSDRPRGGVSARGVREGLREALDGILGAEKAVLFGTSLGGMGVIDYALARPDKVLGLFLCSPGGAPMDKDELESFVDRFRIESHEDALDFMDRVMAKPSKMRQLLAWGLRKKFCHPDMRALLGSITPDDLLKPEELQSLRMPVHVVWGRGDRIFPPPHLDFFRQNLPRHASIEEPEGIGHSAFLEKPGELARRIAAFMREIPLEKPVRRVVWKYDREASEPASDDEGEAVIRRAS